MSAFSGSYQPGDVEFLLERIQPTYLDVAAKERFIQNGGHYGHVLSMESAPSAAYARLFHEAVIRNGQRMAADIRALAGKLAEKVAGPVALVSLARAGTPVGVIAARLMRTLHGREVRHYSVSIVRDHGLDLAALDIVRASHSDASIVFVDGWTGKGVIGRELAASIHDYNQRNDAQVDPTLYVVADIAGTAGWAASRSDYLLPSAVLNSTVSGLVSRTVLPEAPSGLHGCAYQQSLEGYDKSRWFVDHVTQLALDSTVHIDAEPAVDADALRVTVQRYLAESGMASVNHIKPGVGEATRVLLRRVPRLLVLQRLGGHDTAHLEALANDAGVAILIDPCLPCQALAVIDKAD